MERKEPTLSPSSTHSESTEQVTPRVQSYDPVADDVDEQSIKPTNSNAPGSYARPAQPTPRAAASGSAHATRSSQPSPQSSSAVPAIALVIALVAVGGAGFLGWQLLQTQGVLKHAEARIAGLEQQLNLTSEESSASVVTLQANLKKTDADLKKIDADLRKWMGMTETSLKSITANSEKIAAVARDIAAAKKESSEAKSGLSAIRQEVSANKSVADAAAAKIDSAVAGISQQSKNIDDLKETMAKLELELSGLDSLAARANKHEEAIAAIDDFRRSTNRDLLQIKQQLSQASK